VIDAVPTTREKVLETAAAYRQSRVADVAGSGAPSFGATPGDTSKPLIVIDPGHGGIDLGARGEGGTLEKDVVLAFAKTLGDKLIASGRYRVTYTRSDDTFVTLGDRVAVARNEHADLFISIHANSFPGSAIRGAIVYTVSDEASDKMAAELADAENRSDALAGIDVDAQDSDQVITILADLTRRETRNFGVTFAQALVKNMQDKTLMFKIPHKEASFKVLEAPDVPSALIELGYLTNAADEKLLKSADWQARTATGILGAVDAYFKPRVEAANR
jgi:N-acetylmuramoyl-L-alanine amidase